MIASFFEALRQPEYVHVLINPLPVYGLGVGLLGLVIALALRSRAAQVATLVLILFCGAVAWPVGHFGEEGFNGALSLSDAQGQAWLREHARRADWFIAYFYTLAACAGAAIVVPWRWPKAALPLTTITLLLGCVVLGLGGYIASAGGKIRHGEFRREPAPVVPVEQDEP